jgi:outer membrane receptor for ferrienterochelin and colicins
MKRALYLQVILLFLTLQGFSQGADLYKFKGVVVNASSTSEVLVGAHFLDQIQDKVVAISDQNGEFEFLYHQPTLLIRHLGFKDQVVTHSDSSRTILLEVEDDLLNTIVVSENRRASQLKNSTVSLEIIKPELISNTSPTNIEQSLGRINGVQVVDNQPTIRSGSGWSYGVGSRVQVLVNGMPILSGDAGQPLWNFVPTEGVEGIEIIKGASSVIYGSSALNGVINIKTRNPKEAPYTRISLSSGLYDLPHRASLDYKSGKRNTVSNLTAFHSGIHKGVGVSLGINALKDDGYKMSDYDDRMRANLGLRKKLSNKDIIVGLNTAVQKGTSGSFLLWESWTLGYTALDSDITDTRAIRFNIDPYVVWNKGKFNHTLNTRWLHVNNSISNEDPTVDQSNKSNLVYGEYRSRYTLDKHKINATGGVVIISSETQSPLFDGAHATSNIAAYAQLDKKWTRLLLNGGARYEYYSLDGRTEGKPVFRTGANYKLFDFTFARFSYGEGYRFPSIAESYITTKVGPVSIFPNPNLKSETGTNIEIGIKQGFKIKSTMFLFDAAIYEMTFSNMMEFTFGQWGPFVDFSNTGAGFITVNTGDTKINGFEATLSFEHKGKVVDIQGFMGYTLSNTKALEPNKIVATDSQKTVLTYINTSSNSSGNVLKYRPKHQANADIIIQYKKISLGMGLAYQSAIENIDDAFVSFPIDIFIPGIQTSIENKQSEYLIGNMRLGYKFNDTWHLNLIGSNLGNREYVIRPGDIAAPRSFRFQVSYTIDKS